MPQTREVTVYTFDELSERAKDRAREWYREAQSYDDNFAEFIIEDFVKIAEMIGVTLTSSVPALVSRSKS